MKIGLMKFAHDFVKCIGPRYISFMAGRGAGKTHAIIARMKWLCTRYPKFHYMYVSPTIELGQEVYEEMIGDANFMKFVKSHNCKNGCPQINFKNKSWIKFRSMQRPQSLRGKNLHEVGMDEQQNPIYTEAVFNRVLNPMLRGKSPIGNFGTLVMLGQFKGGDDWPKRRFYDFGREHLDDEKTVNPRYQPGMYRSWRIPASEGYIYQIDGGAEEYARRREEHLSAGHRNEWEQEYECIPCVSQYAAFPADQIDDISKNRLWQIGGTNRYRLAPQQGPRQGVGYAVIVDMGRTTDPTGILIGDQFGNIVHEEIYPLGQLHEISARKAAMTAARWNKACLVVDATGGAKPGQPDQDSYVKFYRQFADKFNLDFHPIYQGGNEKVRMVDNVTLFLQGKKFAIPKECVNCIGQLKAYEYSQNKKTKRMEYSGPVGTHDEMCSCVLMYIEALTREWIHVRAGGTLGGLVS